MPAITSQSRATHASEVAGEVRRGWRGLDWDRKRSSGNTESLVCPEVVVLCFSFCLSGSPTKDDYSWWPLGQSDSGSGCRSGRAVRRGGEQGARRWSAIASGRPQMVFAPDLRWACPADGDRRPAGQIMVSISQMDCRSTTTCVGCSSGGRLIANRGDQRKPEAAGRSAEVVGSQGLVVEKCAGKGWPDGGRVLRVVAMMRCRVVSAL